MNFFAVGLYGLAFYLVDDVLKLGILDKLFAALGIANTNNKQLFAIGSLLFLSFGLFDSARESRAAKKRLGL